MHGPGYPPQQPKRDTPVLVIVLRVLFSALPLLSCGVLSWGTMLRVALLTRRPRDWVLFGVVLLSTVGCFGALVSDTSESLSMTRSNVAIGTMLTMAAAAMAYFLYADSRHVPARPAQQYHGPTTPHGLPPQSPPIQQMPPATATPGYGHPPVPQQQQAHTSAPSGTPRIDQVRAELDELSDFLRKGHDGGQDHGQDWGRDQGQGR